MRGREELKEKMKIQLVFLYCYIGLSLVFVNGDDEQVSVLLSIKASLVDPNDHLKDWKESAINSSSSHCSWTGVSCNSKGLVEELDLSNKNLSGHVSDQIHRLSSISVLNLCCNDFSTALPHSLANLSFLSSIDVSSNSFVGAFPAGLGKATGLRHLNASSNNFVGFLPEDLGNATWLEELDFSGSFFEGSIPASFKNLQNLKFLGLSGNNLTGRIPPEIGEMRSLETIILGYNQFEGSIPAEFGNLTSLEYLDLAVGSLSGEIPVEFAKLQNLTTVYLYRNSFEGKIPPEIGNMSSLVFLDLSDNRISGEIPEEIAELKKLQLLSLMCNQLTGPIPDKLSELTKLQVLELWQNSLTGSLPKDLGRQSPLQWLDVSTNSLTGEIPPGLCSSGSLIKIILFNNLLSGSIPKGLGNCSSLIRVRIQNNRFSGAIPPGFGNLPKLQRLELARNSFAGEIPDDFAVSTSLSFIDLSWNLLETSLPSSILSIPSLQTFIASNNKLLGNILDQFPTCPSLSVLDLSNNHFSGEIPHAIASCKRLVKLILRDNQFTGQIPEAIATMPTLAILDLSNNSLVGSIPETFGSSPALETFNLSYNNLEGPLPSSGTLLTVNPNDLTGNTGLCGGMLPQCPHHHSLATTENRVRRILLGFVVAISVILAAGGIVLTGSWLYNNRWDIHAIFHKAWFKNNTSEWPWRLVAFQRLDFTSAEILACLKESNVIGNGGTGIVYKAEVQQPHSIVAVKKLWRPVRDIEEAGDDLLEAEVDILGKLRHRNIVRLLGYLHNQTDVMMVYEYMPNGNLGEALHGKEAGAKLLTDWVSRYNIALGVAHGLAYLHHDCYPPVIHRDIKSNNILLDSNFEARIADFGLARMMHRKNETVSMVAGSYGYIAPEYGYTLKVDEKSDIYSFGVVLLELLTGKMPLDSSAFGEATDIVEWVRGKVKNKASEQVLEPEVAGDGKDVQEEMLLVLRIALLCTAKLPKDRPSMRDIITMLAEAKPRRKSIPETHWESITNNNKLIFAHSPVIGLL